MYRDRDQSALRGAAAATLERIRRHRRRASGPLKKVFTVIARDLFQPSLNAEAAWRRAGIKDHRLAEAFKQITGETLYQYIVEARVEVAEVLMLTTDLDLASISLMVGYAYHPTFEDTYERLRGKRPKRARRKPLPAAKADRETALLACSGLLDEEELVVFVEELLRLYPGSAARLRRSEPAAPSPEPIYVIDGAHGDRLRAEGLWQRIRELPFADQRQRLGRYRFRSTALFDLLLKQSRLEGRKERRWGVEVAELALVSLDGGEEAFGERIHDLRALGWAWLGNARRLALDLSAADAAFEEKDRHWGQPGAPRAPAVAAEISFLEGTLRMFQRRYSDALEELDQAKGAVRLGRRLTRPDKGTDSASRDSWLLGPFGKSNRVTQRGGEVA